MSGRLARVASSPGVYAAWGALVPLTLALTYPGDPYIFGLTAFGFAGLSGAVGLAGLVVAVASRTLSSAARVVIVASVVVAIASTAVALMVLSTFNWA